MRFEEGEVLVKSRFEEIQILKFCGNHTNVVSEISPGSWDYHNQNSTDVSKGNIFFLQLDPF